MSSKYHMLVMYRRQPLYPFLSLQHSFNMKEYSWEEIGEVCIEPKVCIDRLLMFLLQHDKEGDVVSTLLITHLHMKHSTL